jgi:cation/acetate symporter
MLTGLTVAVGMFTAGTLAAGGLLHELLVTPTLVAAPVAALVTVLVSRRSVPPPDVEESWLTMHGTAADRRAERLAQLVVAESRRRRKDRRAHR